MNLINEIKKHEGFRSRVYKCTEGFDTIGYGFAIKDLEIEEDIADLILMRKLSKLQIRICDTFDWYLDSPQEVQDVVGAMFTSNTETRIAATYEDGDGTIDLVVDDMTADTNTQLTQEQVEDYVGGMLDGDETFITVAYDDTDGNIDFTVPVKDEDDMTSDSATHLATQQSIKAYVDSVASTTEAIQDIVGAMFSSNTETFATVTYEDGDGTIDVVVPVKDEDDMTSDSATHLPTQQSVKAYVDTKTAGLADIGLIIALG